MSRKATGWIFPVKLHKKIFQITYSITNCLALRWSLLRFWSVRVMLVNKRRLVHNVHNVIPHWMRYSKDIVLVHITWLVQVTDKHAISFVCFCSRPQRFTQKIKKNREKIFLEQVVQQSDVFVLPHTPLKKNKLSTHEGTAMTDSKMKVKPELLCVCACVWRTAHYAENVFYVFELVMLQSDCLYIYTSLDKSPPPECVLDKMKRDFPWVEDHFYSMRWPKCIFLKHDRSGKKFPAHLVLYSTVFEPKE